MTTPLVLTPAAELDIADALAYYGPLDPTLPLAFRLALDTTLGLIAEYPDSASLAGRGLRRALLRRFPYAVFYRPRASAIQVVRVLHTSRHPRAWHARTQ